MAGTQLRYSSEANQGANNKANCSGFKTLSEIRLLTQQSSCFLGKIGQDGVRASPLDRSQ